MVRSAAEDASERPRVTDAVDLYVELAQKYAGVGEHANRAEYLDLLASDDESPQMRNAMASMSSCALTQLGLLQKLLELYGCTPDRRLTEPYAIGQFGGPAVSYCIAIAKDLEAYEHLPSRLPRRGEGAYVARPDGSGGEHVIACIMQPSADGYARVVEGGQWTGAKGNCILEGVYRFHLDGGVLYAGKKRVFGLMDTRKELAALTVRLEQLERDKALFDMEKLREHARGAALAFAFEHGPLEDRATLPPPEDS